MTIVYSGQESYPQKQDNKAGDSISFFVEEMKMVFLCFVEIFGPKSLSYCRPKILGIKKKKGRRMQRRQFKYFPHPRNVGRRLQLVFRGKKVKYIARENDRFS